MEFLRDTRIDFLGKKIFAVGLSAIFIVLCISLVVFQGLLLGIDFAGGNLIHLKYREIPSLDEIRAALAAEGYSKATLQADTERNEVMIRVQREDSAEAAESEGNTETTAQVMVVDRVVEALSNPDDLQQQSEGKIDLNLAGAERVTELLVSLDPLGYLQEENLPPTMTAQRYARGKYEVISEQLIDHYRDIEFEGVFTIEKLDQALEDIEVERDRERLSAALKDNSFVGGFSKIRAEMVSALVGEELGEQALWSIVFSLGGILVYIWFRFNPRFAVAAITALLHDVTITVGVFTLAGREFNLPIIAAVLTIVGYSLNDTIVVFDRIRENLNIRRREAKENYEGVLNISINQTLSRTLLTSMTTLVVVVFLFVFGGAVINDFAFILMIGILVGTYSSIFVASPVLAVWQKITGTMGGALAKT